ncbi:MAG: 2,3-bisphosphoglycerate-independent phosphoglycerate mutase [Caldilineae bacterium]|nr:2,3-bisphosphoglycerate-independent phosphoglycerate mutase [Caldilineae bacterium]
MTPRRPVLLLILDGWGLRAEREANAVALAETPVFDRLMAEYAHTRLRTSGRDVGLPADQMGNSEVGHLTLGAGAIFDQDLLRIDKAAADGSLTSRPALQAAFAHVAERGSALHLAGLLGQGGVHAHARHLEALLAAAASAGIERVYVHAFTDGRDTAPDSARGFMRELLDTMSSLGIGQVATVSGRYYAMDRDKRWERSGRAWRAMREGLAGAARSAPDAIAAIEAAQAAGETDEFIAPTVVLDAGGRETARIADGDALILFNFRADRMRQLLAILTDPSFDAFAPDRPADLFVASMTEYVKGQSAPAIFEPQDVVWPLARVVSEAGLTQYHTAETEKYAHVTYFFNGGRETPFPGETHRVVPSPKVATYDLAPEMSAVGVTDQLIERLREADDAFLLVNYANPDMVGHSGRLDAAIRAVETVDACLGRVLEALSERDGVALVTADHGNCEMMIDPLTGGPHTAHTLNPVPCILVAPEFRLDAGPAAQLAAEGGLRDVAPTLLARLGLPRPEAMTGRDLVEPVGPR